MNLFQLFSGSFSGAVVERLGWVLVHSLWQFALVAMSAGAAMRMLRRNSAALRYVLLVAAMGVLVAAPAATWMILPAATDDQAANDRLTHNISDSAPAIPSPADGFTPRRDVDLAAMNSAKAQTTDDKVGMIDAGPVELPLLSENFPPTESLWQRAATVLRPWLAWIVSGWSLGVVLCGLRPLLGWHMLWRLRRTGLSPASDEILRAARRMSEQLGLRRAVRVMQSTLAQVPVVIGYLRPMILLPVGLAASIPLAQLEAILAHELAHVRRHDFIVNLLQTLVETLFFYHPAVWWLSRQVRIEREHGCDDLVVARLGNRVEYGRALVAIEELRGAGSLLALGACDGSLLARIRRIIGVHPDRTAARLRDRWPVAAMGLVLIGLACLLMVNGNLVAKQAAVPPVEEETTKDAGAPGLFAGEVVDAVTGKPIEGATVRFIFRKIYRAPGEKNEPVAELVFRNVGRFQFKMPESVNPDEALFVERTAEHPDYQSLSPSGQALKFILKNEPNLSRDFIRKVSLSPGKVVTGQVLDLDGRPAKGIPVTAGRDRDGWQNGCAHKTATDADGRYRLVVPADQGRGRIYVIPDHAAAVSRAISEEFGEQQAFKLLRGTRLFGTVSDAQGRGVAGVVIRADGTERVPWRFAVTDAGGRYSLPPCQYGDYLIELVDEGRVTQLPTAGARLPDVFLPHFVQLPRRAPTEQQLDFTPTESVQVVARYLTSDDHPVTGRGLSLHGRLDKLSWSGLLREVSDDPGLYELRVPRGLVGRIDQNFDSGHFLRIVRDSSDSATTFESKFDESNRAFRVRRLKAASVTLRPQFNGLSVTPAGPLTFPQFADPKAAEMLGARIASTASKVPDPGGVWFNVHPEIDINLKLALPGFKSWEQVVRLNEGEDRIIDIALESGEGAAGQPPAAPPAEPASLRIRNADGGKAVFNSVVKAQLGFPKSKAESWVGWQTRDGLVPLKDLPAGTHWLIAAAEFEQRTPFQLKIPAAQPVIEQRLRVGQGWTAKNIDLEVTVQADEKNGDLIVVEIRNPSKDALRVSEEDLHLTADHDKEQVRGLSPLWLTADRRPFPQSTIPAGETARLSLRWTDWVTRGLWASRNSEVMSEPAFPPPVPGKRWVRVWLGNGSALPVSVTDPAVLLARAEQETEAALERYFAPYRNLRDEDVEKFVLDKLRTPFEIEPEGGSWQSGAFEAQLLGSLSMVRQQDRLVKALLKVVDGTEKSSMDQRRLAMTYLAGAAPRELLPLLIKELDTALRLPAEKKFPFIELEVLERMGEEGKGALPVLVKLLDAARDGGLHVELIRTLASVGPSSKEALQAIASRFDERSSVEVRSRAIYEAARYGELAKPLGPKFTELLQSQSPRIRIWAAWALVTSKADEARGFDVLIASLAKGTAEDRGLSATALAALGKRAQSMLPRLREYENDRDDHVAKEVRDAIRRIQIDDRIFTHAEEAAKAAESRKAVAEARAGLQAASEPSAGKKPDTPGKSNDGSSEPGKPNRGTPETNTPKAKRLNGDLSDRPIRESSLIIRYDIPGGEPTANIAIRAVDENREIGDSSTGRLTWTTVENGGTLTVDHLAAGLYRISRIRIFPLLRNVSGSVYSDVRRTDETDVRLDARDTQTVALSRPRGRKLTGRISGLKEHGLESAVIHICSPKAKNIRALYYSTFYDVRATDADGKFETEPLSPGRYMLLVAGHKLKDPKDITPSDIDKVRYFASREIVIEETGAIPSVELTLSPVAAEHEKARPAAWSETVKEGGTTDEDKDEQAEMKRLFQAVKDHTPLAATEMPAYWRIFGWVRAQSFAILEKRAQWDVLYSQLLEGPDKHRGELLRLRCHVTRALKSDAPENKAGFKTVYELWGSTDESKSFPYVLLTTELPPEFKLGENEPNEGVFVGYFLKWMSYPVPGGKRTVPLLLGRMKHWPQEAAEPPRDEKAKLGTLTGKFIFDGEPPPRKDLAPELSKVDATQRQLPGPDGRYSGVEGTYREFLKKGIRPKTDDPSLLVGKDGGIANILVWVVSKDIPWALPLKEEAAPPAIIRLKDGNYTPRISVAAPGQGLRVENHDPVQFNFHLPLVRNQAVNLMLTANSETWVDYGLAENLPVFYRSDIGTWANGWLFIPGNPFVAVSRPDGSFTLPNLPPGEWEFRVWHERKGFVQHWPKGLFKYTVKRGANDLGTIKLKPEFFAEKLAEPAPAKKPGQESDKTGAEIPEAVRPLLPSIVTVTKINLKSGRPEPDPNWRSGIVVDDRGFILTMWLSGDADREQLIVRLADQSEHPAEVVAADSKLELAVLRIRPERPLAAVSLSKVRLPQKGDAVWSVPSPAQKESKAGVVTGIRQFAGDMFTKTFIESDLPLPLGEGGSLMVADKREPVGVWIAIRAGETRSSYAIALNDIQPLLAKALPPRAAERPQNPAPSPDEKNPTKQPSLKISVTLEPERREILLGEPAWLAFKVINPFEASRGIGTPRGDWYGQDQFRVEVVNPRGERISREVPAPKLPPVEGKFPVPAKGDRTLDLFLPHWVKFTEPGKYRVTARRRLQIFVEKKKEFGNTEYEDDPQIVDAIATTEIEVLPSDRDKLGKLIDQWGTTAARDEKLGRNGDEVNRAVMMLHAIDDERAIPWFLELLKLPVLDDKQRGCQGLAKFASDEVFNALKGAVTAKPEDFPGAASREQAGSWADAVQHTAAVALSENPHPAAADYLLTHAGHASENVRRVVLRHAHKLSKSKPEARQVIDDLTKDPSETIRDEAKRYQKKPSDG